MPTILDKLFTRLVQPVMESDLVPKGKLIFDNTIHNQETDEEISDPTNGEYEVKFTPYDPFETRVISEANIPVNNAAIFALVKDMAKWPEARTCFFEDDSAVRTKVLKTNRIYSGNTIQMVKLELAS